VQIITIYGLLIYRDCDAYTQYKYKEFILSDSGGDRKFQMGGAIERRLTFLTGRAKTTFFSSIPNIYYSPGNKALLIKHIKHTYTSNFDTCTYSMII